MSRFFAGSDSESETSSSEDEQLQQKPAATTARAFQFSDDEEETRRVVRSAKDKRYEEINTIIKHLRNHKKIKDMSNVLQDFEALGKAFEKAKKVVEKEGVPRFYIRCLAELEDFVSECWEDREGRRQMSKNNARGLTTLRQKLRKYNRDFETAILDYKENPDKEGETEDEEEEEEESDSDSGMPTSAADFFRKAPAKEGKEEAEPELDSEDDSSSWGSDSEESSLSSDEGQPGERMAIHFLKKAGGEREEKKEKEKKKKVRKEREDKRHTRADSDGEEEAGWTEVKGGAPALMEKPKMFSKDAEINHEAVYKKLIEIIAARGKKGTDRTEQIDLLIELRSIAAANNLGAAMDVKILFSIIAAIYDYNPNIATSMKPEVWERCLGYIQEVLELLIVNEDLVAGVNITDDSENYEGPPPFRVRGCILTVVERMDEEFTKMLQACDAHSTEYVDRLKDETKVCRIIYKLQQYLEPRATTEEICRVYLKRIQHIYYKYERSFLKKISGSKKSEDSKEKGEKIEEMDNKEITENHEKEQEKKDPVDEEMENENSKEVMEHLCKYIYAKDNTDRIRTRAILCHIYHHALHDRWFAARDLMLMSHLQDTIQHSDVPTQIMYNRGMVQLGLCAFRQGMIKDAHNALVDIQSGGRAKELLAQGLLLQRQHERTPEQEKIEKRRQMPYHMHINLELLECVYLVSAMLLEIPYMAAHEFDARRRMISKNFHHVMRVSDRQPLVGPPESMREHVVAASKAMKTGDWRACKNFIINEKMNSKVWELFHESERVRDMMTQKIQEESLRTYLFTYSSVYDSLSMDTLADMFELDRAVVHSVISKMIINEELMASLDEPTHTVVMHRTEPRRLQSLALQLSEKVSMLVENNERIMEMKQGGYFFQKQMNTFQQGDNRNFNRGYDNKKFEGNRRFDNRGNRGYDNRNQGGYGGQYGNRDRDQQYGGRRGGRQQRIY